MRPRFVVFVNSSDNNCRNCVLSSPQHRTLIRTRTFNNRRTIKCVCVCVRVVVVEISETYAEGKTYANVFIYYKYTHIRFTPLFVFISKRDFSFFLPISHPLSKVIIARSGLYYYIVRQCYIIIYYRVCVCVCKITVRTNVSFVRPIMDASEC